MKRTDYTAILFDFDFTLGDSSVGICESVNHALRSLGHDSVADDAIRALIGLPLQVICKSFTDRDDDEYVRRFRTHFYEVASTRVVESSSLYSGVADMLERFVNNGVLLGIVSTKSRQPLLEIVRKHNVERHFSVIVGGDDVVVHKPHPEGLLKAIAQLGIAPQHALYTGDTIHDAQAAQAAAIDFIAVTSGPTLAGAFAQHPHRAVIPTVSQLDTVILQ
ncbi:MAG: HAD-IA family hydrolase [Bacteroidetes bacterium]|nr:HAD-IA family hydrolase [Bacteroidota bacterium]